MQAKEILEKAKKSIDEILTSTKTSFKKFSEQIKTKFKSKDASEAQTNEETAQNEEAAAKENSAAESASPKSEIQTANSLGRTIALAILGVIASLVFIAAIVIVIKPDLLKGSTDSNTYEFSKFEKKFANVFMRIEFTKFNGDKNLKILQAFFTGIGLIIFGALKIAVLLSAKSGSKKAVSILTLAMTYLACFMLSDKFLLFLIFILLLYFTFDYSCGFSTRVILIKLGILVISAIVIYIAVHFGINSDLRDAAQTIYNGLRLPHLRWW